MALEVTATFDCEITKDDEAPMLDQPSTTITLPKTEETVECRLEDFYSQSTECEFEDCSRIAVHHCCDDQLYWGGCSRLFCEDHARRSKSEDTDTIAYVCRDCDEVVRRWQCYSFCTLIMVLIIFFLLWEVTLAGSIAKLIS